jgi:threonine/homoserine/homoserine lactone efflux protein
MKHIIDTLVGNPILLTIAVIISIFIVISFARKILRAAIVLIAIAVLYIAWLVWHGENPAEKAEKARKSAKEAVEKGKGAVKFIDGVRKMGEGEK